MHSELSYKGNKVLREEVGLWKHTSVADASGHTHTHTDHLPPARHHVSIWGGAVDRKVVPTFLAGFITVCMPACANDLHSTSLAVQ